jgi:hypothetical protein
MLNEKQEDALIKEMRDLIRDLQNQIALQTEEIRQLEFDIHTVKDRFYDC